MNSQTYTFNVEMTCEGCSNAVNRALSRNPNISKVEIDLPSKKVMVTSSLNGEEILECLKKTGKSCSFTGVQNSSF